MKAGSVETCRQELPFSGNMLCKSLLSLSLQQRSLHVSLFFVSSLFYLRLFIMFPFYTRTEALGLDSLKVCSDQATTAASTSAVASEIHSYVLFAPSNNGSDIYSNFFVCLHVLDQSTWTCFALDKAQA